jgi:hypothetical protein
MGGNGMKRNQIVLSEIAQMFKTPTKQMMLQTIPDVTVIVDINGMITV